MTCSNRRPATVLYFYHNLSITLATASSIHALPITITIFLLAPNSFHPPTLLYTHQSFHPLPSLCYMLTSDHKMVNVFHLPISTFLTHPIFSSHSGPCHLPTSILNSAVLPLNLLAIIILCLLHSYLVIHAIKHTCLHMWNMASCCYIYSLTPVVVAPTGANTSVACYAIDNKWCEKAHSM